MSEHSPEEEEAYWGDQYVPTHVTEDDTFKQQLINFQSLRELAKRCADLHARLVEVLDQLADATVFIEEPTDE